MKVIKFRIPIYDWDVTFVEKITKKDIPQLKKILKASSNDKEEIEETIVSVEEGYTNGAEHYYNLGRKFSTVILYRMTSAKQRRNAIAHELRHVLDRLLQHCAIKDIETAGYIAGYLAEKIY